MNYILLMTSAGSLLFTGQMLLELIMGKHMSQTCRYRMLMIVLFTYLVPWVWLRGVYGILEFPSPAEQGGIVAASGKLILDDAAIHATDSIIVTPKYNARLTIVLVWIGVGILAMIVRCIVYFCSRHEILKCADHVVSDVPEELVLSLKKEFGIKRRVRIVRAPDRKRSFTLGALRPVIILQESSEEELTYILRHEFTHIARGDLFVKMLMQLVCCVHWFNPFVYWMNRRLNKVCEKSCDERVAGNMTGSEKEIYARLVLNSMRSSGKTSKRRVPFSSFFASNNKLAEERIRVIMDTRKRKFWEKIVVACAFAALVFADSLTALAYPQVYNVKETPTGLAALSVQGEAKLVRGGVAFTSHYLDAPILYDEQIITAEGEVLPMQKPTKVLCFHKWEDAHYEAHAKDENGGCTTMVYECTYCPRCNTIVIGDYVYTLTYAVCPHDNP